MSNKPCKIDDCDAYHCPRCRRHTLGYIDYGLRCDMCELEQEETTMRRLEEQAE